MESDKKPEAARAPSIDTHSSIPNAWGPTRSIAHLRFQDFLQAEPAAAHMRFDTNSAVSASRYSVASSEAIFDQSYGDTLHSSPHIGITGISSTEPLPARKSYHNFWITIVSLALLSAVTGLESTVVSTALPTMVADLDIGSRYVWVTNSFFLGSNAIQPLFGQLADVFGRKRLLLVILVIHAAGSAMCGAANGAAMLIAGRTVQGIGSGGILLLRDIIVSDLIPLRRRGNYVAMMLTISSVGTALGPFFGGIITQDISWRWIFFISLPITGISAIMLLLFFHAKRPYQLDWKAKLKEIDYAGSVIIMSSTVAILIAFTDASHPESWKSLEVLIPLVLGLEGLALFGFYEAKVCSNPLTPPRVFGNRTTVITYILIFLNAILTEAVLYFMPIYFQAVRRMSPSESGLSMLPLAAVAVPTAIMAALLLAKFGRYKPLHVAGFAAMSLCMGLLSALRRTSSVASYVTFQIIGGLGTGVVVNTLLPASQAGLQENDVASATATFGFFRTFGTIWGVSIPSAVFNTRTQALSQQIQNPVIRDQLSGGQAYQFGTSEMFDELAGSTRDAIISVFSRSLRNIWLVMLGFAVVGFLLVFGEVEIPLRTDLKTEYGESKDSDSS